MMSVQCQPEQPKQLEHMVTTCNILPARFSSGSVSGKKRRTSRSKECPTMGCTRKITNGAKVCRIHSERPVNKKKCSFSAAKGAGSAGAGCKNDVWAYNVCKKHSSGHRRVNGTHVCIHKRCRKMQKTIGYCGAHYAIHLAKEAEAKERRDLVASKGIKYVLSSN